MFRGVLARPVPIVLSVVLATVLAACSASGEVVEEENDGTFVGVDGEIADVSDTSRIVSLTGDITETIFELGLGDNIVAVDLTTTYPPEALDLRSTGGSVGFGRALAAEAVLKHEPTLVVGDESIEPPEAIEQLRDAGVPVVILAQQATFAEAETKILELARVLNVVQAGEELAKRVAEEITVAQDRAENADVQPRVAYVYVRGPSVLYVFGDGLSSNAMIEGAGALDVGAPMGEGAIALTPEALIAAAPDVIILPEAGVAALGGISAVLEIPGVSETPAGQNQAFLVYDEAYFLNLGPRVGLALNDFVNDLYSGLAD